ncbi:MAG: glycogen/starch synthase, partial [Mesotoga sp.]|nr:glycogen/starch synthase [Mesotoga sp.]
MKVLYVSYEVYPLAKVGGLADVAGALPKYLRDLGVEIDILMPFHKSVDKNVTSKTGSILKTRFMKREISFELYKKSRPLGNVDVFLLSND